MNKKTYCPMPFITLAVNPGNYISRCMMSMKNMGPITSDTYSNSTYQTLRQNMLDGVWDEDGCETCFVKEKDGLSSQRTKWLEREEKYLGETGIYESNLSIERNKIYHLYMNFSNICNFKCRMCGPHFSNAWIPDYNKLAEQGVQRNINVPPKQQVDIDKFFSEFGNDLSDLRQIWITGGEPFIDDSVFKFVERLSTYVDLSRIKCVINTNLSKLDTSKVYAFDQFKKMTLNVSMDAVNELYPYMRGYNFSFAQADAKIKELMTISQSMQNLHIGINAGFQIYNILNIVDFWNWAKVIHNHKPRNFVSIIVVNGPRWLRARNAPESIKQESKKLIQSLIDEDPEFGCNFYLEDCLKELNHDQSSEDIEKFITWNTELDNIRNEYLKQVFPKLIEEWKKEGIHYE